MKISYYLTGFLLWLLSAPLQADIFNSADFRISATEQPGSYELSAQVPTALINSTEIRWPDGCRQTSFDRQPFGNRTQLLYKINCTTAFDDDAVIRTPWMIDGARLDVVLSDSESFQTTVQRSLGGMSIPLANVNNIRLTAGEVATTYLWQGMLHIWFGWDHLAFVFCLCLLATGYRLLALISMFTIGHSLTLCLAYFGVVNVPIQPIEVLIALSIVLMAREALFVEGGKQKFGLTASMAVVILFGLIHGLGFASALSELGVPEYELWLSLLFFNLGVELGQIAFILALIGISRLLKSISMEKTLRYAALYSVGAIGIFWAIERVAGFGQGLI